jgi:hypothetical protein
MSKSVGNVGELCTLGLAIACLLLPAMARAQEMEGDPDLGPNQGNVTVDLGLTITSQYLFRGYNQEDQGFIAQTNTGINFSNVLGEALADNPVISPLTVSIGLWNSFHDQKTGATGTAGAWYEADLWAGVSTTIADTVDLGFTYVAYVYPNGAFATIHELQWELSYDDSESPWLGDVALNPYALFAVEIQDGGGTDDAYFELGITPSFVILDSQDWPVTLAIPVVVGLSLDDYYISPAGNSDIFGYVSTGLHASVPLTAVIDQKFGNWSFTLGVDFFFLGSATQAANNGDDFQAVGFLAFEGSY